MDPEDWETDTLDAEDWDTDTLGSEDWEYTMAAAADTNLVTEARGVQKEALAANAARKSVRLVNVTGVPVQIILGSEELPYDWLASSGPDSRMTIDGDAAQVAINLRCDHRALEVYCTAITA